MLAIPLEAVTKKPGGAKPPVWYGKVLQSHREAMNLSRKELKEATGIDAVKILRNEIGHDDRSVKGSNEIREALIKLGRDVPAVPVGEDVPEPASGDATAVAPVDSQHPKARTIRLNLRRLREAAGYDVEGLADAVNISAETLLEYERGEKMIPFTDLEEIAERLGHEVMHFSAETPPASTLGPYEDFWRRRRLHARLTPEQKARKREADEQYARQMEEILSSGAGTSIAAEKRAQGEHFNKAKTRRSKQ